MSAAAPQPAARPELYGLKALRTLFAVGVVAQSHALPSRNGRRYRDED
jgi:hypothetical protein